MKYLGRSKLTVSALALGAALLCTSVLGPGHAFASYSSCRSDPALVLSNGAVLDLSASIGADTSNVSRVDYTVHLPAGVKPLVILNTDGLMGIKEHFTYISDDSRGAYDAYTTVTLTSGSAPVTANGLLIALLSLKIQAPNVNGTSGSPVHVHLGS